MKKIPKIVVIGGGWAGCATAASARKAGSQVDLIERTDMLLGTGLVGGIFRNNGRYTVAEEMINLGDELFKLLDNNTMHKNVEFPGHHHASLYKVWTIEPIVKKYLSNLGINIIMQCRIDDIFRNKNKILSVMSKKTNKIIEGDVFIDATGTSGVLANCTKYGNGCAMCIQRCHSFGQRVDLLSKAGIEHWDAKRADGSVGAMSGACKLAKESLSSDIVDELEKKGCALVSVPVEVREDIRLLSNKACQQYATKDFIDNLVLLDTGPVKLMTPFFPLEDLRKVPGMEKARYEDPLAGGKGNSMRYFGFANCEKTLKAIGEVDNLFCAGEKAGAMVGHTEAIVTGSLAGHNSVRYVIGKELLELPESLAVGDFVNSTIKKMKKPEGRTYKYTFSGSVYFERMKEKNLYSINNEEIAKRVKKTNLEGIFAKKMI
ncbi:hypothetical protein ES705_03939 [subsurface metagenome]